MSSSISATVSKNIFSVSTYAAFKKELSESNCSKCDALCQDRHNIVVDRGNSNTDIVIIGEAPGENEDLQGRAFVGRAGKLLDEIMRSINLDTNTETLIINVVKCRPPANRAPTREEAANCLPYLKWQLNFVKPKVVLLLGATAAKHLLTDQKGQNMKDRVGRFFDVPEFPHTRFMLLFHPAYLLRDPRKKKDMGEHVKYLREYLNTLKI